MAKSFTRIKLGIFILLVCMTGVLLISFQNCTKGFSTANGDGCHGNIGPLYSHSCISVENGPAGSPVQVVVVEMWQPQKIAVKFGIFSPPHEVNSAFSQVSSNGNPASRTFSAKDTVYTADDFELIIFRPDSSDQPSGIVDYRDNGGFVRLNVLCVRKVF